MGLQRWYVARGGLDLTDCPDECGEWVRWADVDALLARIRAAVDAERGAVEQSCIAKDVPGVLPSEECGCDACGDWLDARAALDALLSQEVTDG